MKFVTDQQTSPATATTLDFTDSSLASDLKAVLMWASSATANNTSANITRFWGGLSDLTTHGSFALAANNNAATTQVSGNNTTNLMQVVNPNGGTSETVTLNSTLSNGIRSSWATISAQRPINALMFGGSDVTASVRRATFTGSAAPETLTVNHGLGATPDVLIAFSYLGSGRFSQGFYKTSGGVYASTSYTNVTGQTGAQLGGYVSDNALIRQVSNNANEYAVTVANVGSTSFDLVATGATTTDTITILSLRITGAAFYVGVATTPTSTGTWNVVTGMGGQPSLLMMLPSRIQNVNTFDNTDQSGQLGLTVFTNNSGSTEVLSTTAQSDDGANPTAEFSYTSNTKFVITDTAGTPDFEATHSSWNSDGASLSVSNAAASALKIPVLAIGPLANPPGFTVSPTVTSQTTSAYTLGFTANAASTFYSAVVPAGATTPTTGQIKAGTGGGILFAANKAVTGADSLTITLSGTLFPKYKIVSLLNNAGGDSSIVVLDNEFLDPPTGKQFRVLDAPMAATSPLVNVSPAIADSDVWVIDLETTPDGLDVTTQADGDLDIANLGDESPNTIAHDVYDDSLQAYYGAGTIYINYQPPEFAAGAVIIIPLNVPMTPYELDTLFTDPQGNPVAVTAIDTPPPGLSVISDSLTGTATVAGVYEGLTIRGTGVSGDYTDGDYTALVGNIPVPDIEGLDEATANLVVAQAYFVYAASYEYSATVAAGIVIRQSPAAGTTNTPLQQVQATVSLGPAPPIDTSAEQIRRAGGLAASVRNDRRYRRIRK